MIKLLIDDMCYNLSTWEYPAGEIGVRIPDIPDHIDVDCIVVQAAIHSSDDIMVLAQVSNAIALMYPFSEKRLALGYMPYGRQDRVAVSGDALSIQVFAQLISTMGFGKILMLDNHSQATNMAFAALGIPFYEMQTHEIFPQIYNRRNAGDKILLVPDAGAAKKFSSQPELTAMFKDVQVCDKTRNPVNGKIEGIKVPEIDWTGQKVVIIDDICDGGGTFLGIAEQLRNRNVESIDLIVVHGIFTSGTEKILAAFDNVYTTNSYHMDREGLVDGINYLRYF